MLFSGSSDDTIKVWEKQNDQWKCIKTLDKHKNWVTSLFYANGMLFSGAKDSVIKVWENKQWMCIQTLPTKLGLENHLFYANGVLFTACWNEIKIWSYKPELPASTIVKV